VEKVEKQNQLSHFSNRPLEIAINLRFPHSHSFGFAAFDKVENQKPVSHFPSPLATTAPLLRGGPN